MLWFCVALISPTSASLQQMFDLDQQLHQPTYCWQYCSQRQPSADCYGLLLDEGLKRKKLCHCRQKRGWAEWFKGHSCQRVLVQTPGTFYIISRRYRTTGSSQTLFSRPISASFIWLTEHPPPKKRRDLVVLKCHAPQKKKKKKSTPYTIDPNNKNVITIKFLWLNGPHGSLANPFTVILIFSTKKTYPFDLIPLWIFLYS